MKRRSVVCNSTERIGRCDRMKRWSVLLLVFGAFFLTFSALSPLAFAQPTALWLEESPYTHSDVEFVPGESMKIHIEGPEGDVYDICVTYDPWPGQDLLVREWDDRTVPAGGEILLEYLIPSSADVGSYRMEVWNSARTQAYLSVNYSVIPFNQMVLELLLELQDETTELTNQLASLQQDLSQMEGNISQLQTDIDNLQSTVSDIQTGLAAVIDDMDDLTSSMDDLQDQIENLENQIEDLQTDIANLEEKQASESDFAGTNDMLTYLALIFGIAGLVIGLLAMFRKGPSRPQEAPIEQPIPQP